jgi:hypothetical protein
MLASAKIAPQPGAPRVDPKVRHPRFERLYVMNP